ncbi:Uncharacterised protein [Moraxella caviae]|nr:hypothetical protein [Moraxella caviae]STZ13736.1 Uncharacterised protein [Moraxella caviae]
MPLLDDGNRLNPHAIQRMGQPATPEFSAIRRLLNGIDLPLPDGISMTDKMGIVRHNARVKWWLNAWQTHPISQTLFADNLPNTPLTALNDELANFHIATDKPIFIGHYWLDGAPRLLSKQVVCVDYSAGKDGFLTAYQFDTDNPTLSADNFVQFTDEF